MLEIHISKARKNISLVQSNNIESYFKLRQQRDKIRNVNYERWPIKVSAISRQTIPACDSTSIASAALQFLSYAKMDAPAAGFTVTGSLGSSSVQLRIIST